MKQNYPVNGSNQSGNRNQTKPFSGAHEPATRNSSYRSVILAVSGSLLCVVAGERAAGQSAGTAPQGSGQMQEETAQTLPPAIFNGINMIADNQWPSQPLQPASPPLYSPNSAPAAPAPVTPPAASSESSTVTVTNSPAPAVTPVATTDANTSLELPGMALPQPKVYQNELSASADFMYGRGTITVPVGYGLSQNNSIPGSAVPIGRQAVSADRSTIYYGGTVSYSYGRSWYLDFSAENGRSTGSTTIDIPNLVNGEIPSSFDVNDTWYQMYLRYNFKNGFLAGTRFGAYLRGGVSLVQATLTANNNATSLGGKPVGPGSEYSDHDNTFDVLGNLGFGLTYSLHSTFRFKAGLQLEGEGFGGDRSQDIDESFDLQLFNPNATPLSGHTTINDTVYGAIGRLMLHAEYKLGNSGRWKLTGDLGVMTIYSFVTYPGAGTKDELLYGPYAKAGLSFLF
ncbi:MAG TPA: hypothetical protein VGY56_21960 [Verrucomicrobiae bacterium]|nr:hypothetical protein [Verrucomicrobiae bacterium]